MADVKPNILQMARAPFLSSVISPLVAGSLLAAVITGDFSWIGFVLVLLMGIGLHVATNVYNDIYDTLQGTDRVNRHRNQFSGGSGILIRYPEWQPKMFALAHAGLVLALAATLGLMGVVKSSFWLILWPLLILAAFFSKYYSAAPVKLASRGLGEFFVWFAFGPMAMWVAALSQNLGFHPTLLIAMAPTGISTLSILLIGQMIDHDADRETGKWGIAVRRGTRITGYFYLAVQSILMLNIIFLAVSLGRSGWPILLALLPYIALIPKIWPIIRENHDQPQALKTAAKLNVTLHLLFSLFFSLGMGLILIF